ncbi:hypothetical protein HanPI659440_Chr07g0269181 [Helianthus annuus]|nr:hypothetical protein HanPI659440_Chr07g0269181 [Helianthus annuus]
MDFKDLNGLRMLYTKHTGFTKHTRIYETCMIFMSRDGNVLATTTRLGLSAYAKRDHPVSSCSPFSFKRFRFYNSRGEIHVTMVWLSYKMN